MPLDPCDPSVVLDFYHELDARNALTCQISAQSSNAWLNCWWFNSIFFGLFFVVSVAPCFQMQAKGTELYQIWGECKTIIGASKLIFWIFDKLLHFETKVTRIWLGRNRGQISHFWSSVKVTRGMGELFESIFRGSPWTQAYWYTNCRGTYCHAVGLCEIRSPLVKSASIKKEQRTPVTYLGWHKYLHSSRMRLMTDRPCCSWQM